VTDSIVQHMWNPFYTALWLLHLFGKDVKHTCWWDSNFCNSCCTRTSACVSEHYAHMHTLCFNMCCINDSCWCTTASSPSISGIHAPYRHFHMMGHMQPLPCLLTVCSR